MSLIVADIAFGLRQAAGMDRELQCAAETIIRGKGDYLLDAKWNQPVLEEEIEAYVQDEGLRKTMDCTSASKRPLSQIMFNCLLNPPAICCISEN